MKQVSYMPDSEWRNVFGSNAGNGKGCRRFYNVTNSTTSDILIKKKYYHHHTDHRVISYALYLMDNYPALTLNTISKMVRERYGTKTAYDLVKRWNKLFRPNLKVKQTRCFSWTCSSCSKEFKFKYQKKECEWSHAK